MLLASEYDGNVGVGLSSGVLPVESKVVLKLKFEVCLAEMWQQLSLRLELRNSWKTGAASTD